MIWQWEITFFQPCLMKPKGTVSHVGIYYLCWWVCGSKQRKTCWSNRQTLTFCWKKPNVGRYKKIPVLHEYVCWSDPQVSWSNVPVLTEITSSQLHHGPVVPYLVHQDLQTVPKPLANLRGVAAALREKACGGWMENEDFTTEILSAKIGALASNSLWLWLTVCHGFWMALIEIDSVYRFTVF